MNTTRSVLAVLIAANLVACGGGSSNDTPEFKQTNYRFTGSEDSVITGAIEATDDDDALSYTVANAAFNGVFALNADGSFSYTPHADFFGQDTVRVQVSDGNKQSQVDVSFEVVAVNDAPVLTTTTLKVATSGESKTTLQATDADGDTLSFSLLSDDSNSGTITVSESGEVSYVADALQAVGGSFLVSYTDGVIAEPLQATIQLQAAQFSNQDRASYYYSSERSHTKQAEIYQSELDDIGRNTVSIQLAVDYYRAGFDGKAEEVIQSIRNVQQKSQAYRLSALELDNRGQGDKAATLRAEAEKNYNLYLLDKGLGNLNANDATFYQLLNRDYLNAGQLDAANQLMASVALYAEAVHEEEYTTPWGYFLTSYADAAKHEVTAFLNTQTEAQRQRAQSAVMRYAEMAEKTSPKRGKERVKSEELGDAVELFYLLNDTANAKQFLAKQVALYVAADYDPEHSYPVSAHAETNLNDVAGLLKAPAMFDVLYPGAENNIAYQVIDQHGFVAFWLDGSPNLDLEDAQHYIDSTDIVNGMIAGGSADEVMTPIEANYLAAGDVFTMWNYFDATVEVSGGGFTTPYGSRVLHSIGYQQQGLAILNRVSDTISSDAYVMAVGFDDAFGQNSFITGRKGCRRLAELQQAMGGDLAAQTAVCEQVVNTYYTPEAGLADTDQVIKAHRDLMATFYLAGDKQKIAAAADVLQTAISSLDELEDRAEQQVLVAEYLLQYGLYDKSTSALDLALASLSQLVASDDGEQVVVAIELLANELLEDGEAENSDRFGYLYATKLAAAEHPDYAAFYADVMAKLSQQVKAATAKALTLTDQELFSLMPDLVKINVYTDQLDVVDSLIANDVNAAADQLTHKQAVASYLAELDDLPASEIATVDTDHDGKPNFFGADVTQEQIDASGLVLDEDSDNDGTPDSEDNTPLGE